MLASQSKTPLHGRPWRISCSRGERAIRTPEEESGEQLLVDPLRADDRVVEIVDQGPDPEGQPFIR